jgi:serine/threonine protein kinase
LTQQAGTIDHPTDIYQLGVVSYELLTGQLPFTSDRPLDLQRQIRETEPIPPSAIVSELPEEIDEVIYNTLAKKPAQRYERIILLRNRLADIKNDI